MKNINGKEMLKGISLILIYFIALPLLIQSIFLLLKLPIKENTVIIINMTIYLLMLIILLLIYRKSIFKEAKDYLKNFKTLFPKSLTTWLKALAMMMMSNIIIISLLGNIAQNEQANRTIISAYPLFSFISMAILGPFLEEVLFRKGFKNVFKRKEHFCIFTALLFGFGHVIISIDLSSVEAFLKVLPQFLFIIPYASMGYFFAKSYEETNNIFTSVMSHVIHNTFVLCLVFIGG